MESAGETDIEGGGRATSVHNFLSGGDPGSIIFWVIDLGFVGGDVPEAGEVACGIPKVGNRTEGRAEEVRDLEKCDSIEGP